MAAPKPVSGMNTRQKVTAAAFAVVVLVLLYMVYSMFVSDENATGNETPVAARTPPNGAAPAPAPATIPPPKQAALPKQPEPTTPQQAQMVQMQQQNEVRYLEALNQLQLLKVQKEIAETNKAIISARLESVTAQKNIVDLLKPAPATPATYQQGLVGPTGATATTTSQQMPPINVIRPPSEPETNYTVISVSLLRSQWNAVIGYQGNLYSVHVGDVLPIDGSKVVSIDSSGLILEKGGIRRKLSMVPII